MELTEINSGMIEREEEIVTLAKRILKVYGKTDTPTLDREIRRMARMLGIPLEEVLKHG